MKHKSFFPVFLAFLSVCCILSLTAGCTGSNSETEKAAIRANDIADCNNIMSWHVWYHASYLNNIELEKIWVETPEYQKTAVWAQNANYWIGMDNIKAYYGPATPHEQTKGGFQFHVTTTGLVEIAGDRQTAKGVWYTPGAIGMGGSIQGMWERYAIDFVRENGEWKIWHLHVYTDFAYSLKSGSGGGMGGGMMGGGAPQGMGGEGAPDMSQGGAPPTGGAPPSGGAPPGMGGQGAPSGEQAEKFGTESGAGAGMGAMVQSQATAEVAYKEVSDESYADLIPRPPEPYKTFSDTWSYGDPDEVKMFSGEYKEWSEIKKIYNK